MESLNPPLEVVDWHDAGIAFQQAFKAIVDDHLEDSQGVSEDAFLFSMFFTVAPYFEPVKAAIAEMDPEVEARMVAAGCIENGASAGGQVITDFAAISAGFAHTCGLMADGSVACWGQDLLDEAAPPAGAFVTVSVGFQHHTCGLRSDGTAACRGDDGEGQATAPDGEFISVDAGGFHSCGIRTDASAICWGSNEDGLHTPPGDDATARRAQLCEDGMGQRRRCHVGRGVGLHRPRPGAERVVVPAPTLEATPEWAPASPPRNLYVVDRTETSLSVVWNNTSLATHYDVQRGDSANGQYAIVATEVDTLGILDDGLASTTTR